MSVTVRARPSSNSRRRVASAITLRSDLPIHDRAAKHPRQLSARCSTSPTFPLTGIACASLTSCREIAMAPFAISRQLVSDAHAMPVNGKVGLVEHRADNCRGYFAARSWIGRSLRSVIADATRLREFELGRARTVTLMHVAVECRGARR